MKTQSYNIYKHLFAVILLLLTVQNMQAQSENAAFYIYRNDGDFNGFFLDQVKEIRYSKFDKDMVEQDDYVMQEVETADSIYRIPLIAIDSVGFVQPEIKYNPRLRLIDDEPMRQYLVAAGSSVNENVYYEKNYLYPLAIEFSSAIPANLLPKVGDILVGLEGEEYEGGSFGGKVAEIDNNIVYCDYLTNLGDIFQQFITVEELGTDSQGNARRRIAGIENDTINNRRVSGASQLSLIDWSGRLQLEWKPTEKSSVNVGVDLGIKIGARVAYDINFIWDQRARIKLELSEEFSAGVSANASLDLSKSSWEKTFELPVGSNVAIKFPANLPLFEVKPLPVGFTRFGGSITASLAFPKFEKKCKQTFIFDTRAKKMLTCNWNDVDEPSDDESSFFENMEAGLIFNGYWQTGIKQSCAIETNNWVKKIFFASIGLDIYAGPKIEASVGFTANGKIFNGAGIIDYKSHMGGYILQNQTLEFSTMCIDRELKAKYSSFLSESDVPEEHTFWSDTQKWGSSSATAGPSFEETSVRVDTNEDKLIATFKPTGDVFWPNHLGALFIGEHGNSNYQTNIKDTVYYEANSGIYWAQHPVDSFEVSTPAKLYAGSYRIYPVISVFGYKFPSNEGMTSSFIPTKISATSPTVSYKEQDVVVNVSGNWHPRDLKLKDREKGADILFYHNPYTNNRNALPYWFDSARMSEDGKTLTFHITENVLKESRCHTFTIMNFWEEHDDSGYAVFTITQQGNPNAD